MAGDSVGDRRAGLRAMAAGIAGSVMRRERFVMHPPWRSFAVMTRTQTAHHDLAAA
jgi:hypothetical protein